MILPSGDTAPISLALTAAVAYAVPALAASRFSAASVRRVALTAWLLHGLTLAWAMLAGAPRFGFAPALSVTAWLVAAVYAVESHVYPKLQTRWALSALGAAAVLLALVFPGSPLHATASLWLPLHWALGIASYGLFGVAVAHGWFMTRAEDRIRLAADPHSGIPLLTLERLTFHFVTAGFALLTATLFVALVFGDQLYGSQAARKWDHKTVFSILSWLTFAVLLIGRFRFGWRGRVAVRVLYMGSGLLLLAYVGSRFVMEVIFGTHAVKILVVLLLVLAGVWLLRSGRSGSARKDKSPSAKGRAHAATNQPVDMVQCSVCNVHMPRTDALVGGQGLYCSHEHLHRGEGLNGGHADTASLERSGQRESQPARQ